MGDGVVGIEHQRPLEQAEGLERRNALGFVELVAGLEPD